MLEDIIAEITKSHMQDWKKRKAEYLISIIPSRYLTEKMIKK